MGTVSRWMSVPSLHPAYQPWPMSLLWRRMGCAVKLLKYMSSQYLMEKAKKLQLEKQPELTSLLLTLVKDTKKEELVRQLKMHGKLLVLVEIRIMFSKLLWRL